MKLTELAGTLGESCRLAAGQDPEIARVASAGTATGDALVFAEDEASLEAALRSAAGAVAVKSAIAESAAAGKPLLLCGHPRLAFARAARLLQQSQLHTGIHPTAAIAAGVTMGQNVSIGAYAVVGAGSVVGDRVRIDAGAVVGEAVRIGADCHLYPRVVIYPGAELGERVMVHAGAVLGADGFGYVRDAASGEYLQFPQQGRLVIEDDVEIGANATLDRGALEETRIERGVKLDNLVHIGHNVQVGRNVVIAAQTGVSGSSTIGQNAIVGGQVGIADHVAIGEGVILGAQAGIPSRKKIKGAGIVFWGTPARPIKEYLKELAALARLTRRAERE
jgi:UDP-3-O-[3-hydroxymyristoyl] glucosamine N-acyltransferase